MCNVSLSTSCLPNSQKKAIVTPALNKSDELRNYRPISNLTFVPPSSVNDVLVNGETSHWRTSDAQAPVCLPPVSPASLDWSGTGESTVGHTGCGGLSSGDLLGLLDLSAAFWHRGSRHTYSAAGNIVWCKRYGSTGCGKKMTQHQKCDNSVRLENVCAKFCVIVYQVCVH